MTKDEILALTIAELKMPLQTRNWAVQTVGAVASRKLRTALHSVITVGEVLSSLPAYSLPKDTGRYRSIVVSRFFEKLAKLGLTRLDCLYIPQWTLTDKVKRSLSKEEWLDRPAYLLGTLSTAALHRLSRYGDGVFTVRELLASASERWRIPDGCERSVATTRTLLRKLGFAYEDGPFMQFNTLREQAERIAGTYGLGERAARKFVRIARAEGWLLGRLE